MNHKLTIALLGTALAVTIGIMGLNGVFSMPSGIATTTAHGNENLLGHVTVYLTGQDGQIKAYRQMDNVVTNVGRTCTAVAVFGIDAHCSNANNMQYVAIGTATVTEVTSDTMLYAPQNRLVRSSYSITNSSAGTGGIATESATFGFSSSLAIAEAGIFDASSATGGHMYARKTISPVVNVQSGDTLTVTWSVTTG